MPAMNGPRDSASGGPSPLWAVLWVTFLCSMSTGVFWNGIFFIAERSYGLTPRMNLVLGILMGVIYTAGAFTAGGLLRAVEHRWSPRTVLAAVVSLQAVASAVPVAVDAEWALWAAGGAASYLSSLIWPIVESYISAGRHGGAMRSVIGWFNLTWTSAVAVSMISMAALIEHHARWCIGSMTVVTAASLIGLARFPRSPGSHDAEAAAEHVSPEYPQLLRSARLLLPMGYVLVAAMSPILPYRLEQLGVEVTWKTPATATWMVVRVAAIALMWRAGFWHGRWGTLLLGALAMIGGFAVVVLAPRIEVMIGGFAVFGIGIGIIYYAALYYAMAVGRAAVDAGGMFEALIGIGYTIGPAAGLAGLALGGAPWIVAIVCGLCAIGTVGAIRPYREALPARRRRTGVER
jgi:hypothetical protein